MSATSESIKVRKAEELRKLSQEEFAQLQKAAEAGNEPIALYELALCYEQGLRVELSQDVKPAIECLERAAARGFMPAQYDLAVRYLNGEGVVQDVKRAVDGLTQLVNKDYAEALSKLLYYHFDSDGNFIFQHNEKLSDFLKLLLSVLDRANPSKILDMARNLLDFLCNGHMGLPRNEKALEDYRTAARQANGEMRAQFNLGWCYEEAVGVPQDLKYAAEFYQLAADQGYIEAQKKMMRFYQDGTGVQQNNELAARYAELAANQGNAFAQSKFGYFLEQGIGVPKNMKRAAEFYKLSADQGNAYAQARLGYCYEEGMGVPKDMKRAAEFYKLSADQGDASAQANFGECCLKGEGVPRDTKLAVEYYTKAAEQNNKRAIRALAYWYHPSQHHEGGPNTPENLLKAVGYHTKLANWGYLHSQLFLAEWYGNGVRLADSEINADPELYQDDKLAAEFYQLAADQGDAFAQGTLGYFYENGIGVIRDQKEADARYQAALIQWDKTNLVCEFPFQERPKKSLVFLTKIILRNKVQNLTLSEREFDTCFAISNLDPDWEQSTLEPLINAVRQNTSLRSLDLSRFIWAPMLPHFLAAFRGQGALTNVLPEHRSLSNLTLPTHISNLEISHWGRGLSAFLTENHFLKVLEFDFFNCEKDGDFAITRDILQAIPSLPLLSLKINAEKRNYERVTTLLGAFFKGRNDSTLMTLSLGSLFSFVERRNPYKPRISNDFFEALSRFSKLCSFSMNEVGFDLDPLLLINALRQLKQLQVLFLKGISWRPTDIESLTVLLPQKELSTLTLIDGHSVGSADALTTEQSKAFIDGITKLRSLTSLTLNGYFLGSKGCKEGLDALLIFMKTKACALTNLMLDPKNPIQSTVIYSDEFGAQSKALTEGNKTKQKQNAEASMLIAFRRANRTSALRDSGLPLLPGLMKLAEYDVFHRRNFLNPVDAPIPGLDLQGFMETRLFKSTVDAPPRP